jgi:hypothetical protein
MQAWKRPIPGTGSPCGASQTHRPHAADYFGPCGALAAAAAGFSGMMFAAAGTSPGLAAFASCEYTCIVDAYVIGVLLSFKIRV